MNAAKKLKNIENMKFMTLDEVSKRTTYHRKTLERFIREGRLKALKINGRRLIMESDFISFLESSLTDGNLIGNG